MRLDGSYAEKGGLSSLGLKNVPEFVRYQRLPVFRLEKEQLVEFRYKYDPARDGSGARQKKDARRGGILRASGQWVVVR